MPVTKFSNLTPTDADIVNDISEMPLLDSQGTSPGTQQTRHPSPRKLAAIQQARQIAAEWAAQKAAEDAGHNEQVPDLKNGNTRGDNTDQDAAAVDSGTPAAAVTALKRAESLPS